MSSAAQPSMPVLSIEEPDGPGSAEIEALLREAQRLVFRHPIVSQAVIAAFALEGRRFAKTPEGRRWLTLLSRSDLYRKGRELWYVGTLGMFSEKSTGALPSAMVDAFVRAVSSGDIQSILSIFTRRSRR